MNEEKFYFNKKIPILNKNVPIGIWLIVISIAYVWFSELIIAAASIFMNGLFAVVLVFPIVSLLFSVLGFFALKNLMQLNSKGWKLSVLWFSLKLLQSLFSLALVYVVPELSVATPKFAIFTLFNAVFLAYLFSKRQVFEENLHPKKQNLFSSITQQIPKEGRFAAGAIIAAAFLTFFGPVNFFPNLIALFFNSLGFSLWGYYSISFILWSGLAVLLFAFAKLKNILIRSAIALVFIISVLWPLIVIILFRDPLGLALITSARFYHSEFNVPMFTPPAIYGDNGWTITWHSTEGEINYENEAGYNHIYTNLYRSEISASEKEFKTHLESLTKDGRVKTFIEEYEKYGSGRGCKTSDIDMQIKNIDGKKVSVKICTSSAIGGPFEGKVTIN